MPSFRLSDREAAQAKRLAEQVAGLLEREKKAELNWAVFQKSFRTTHPADSDYEFTLHFQFAAIRSANIRPFTYNIPVIKLTPEEQRHGQASYNELTESRAAYNNAASDWQDEQLQLILDHVGASPSSGITVVRKNGDSFNLPDGWTPTLLFSPDFRLAMPR